MQIIPITADYDQSFSFIANSQRVTLRLRYNVTTERWSFDLSRDDQPIIIGKRLLTGANSLAAHDFDLGGLLFHGDTLEREPNFGNVINGRVELVHLEPDELP